MRFSLGSTKVTRRGALQGAAGALSVLALAGCNGAAGDGADGENGGPKLGLAMHNQSETWAVQFADSFKAAAEEAGATVTVTDANTVAASQVSQIEDLVSQGIDALVVLPADYTALGQALKTAHDAGVKVVNADSKVTEEDQDLVDCFVTADAYQGGVTCGEYLAEVLPENAQLGTLNYSVLSVIADRFTGLRDALDEQGRTDVSIVEKDCTDLSAIASYPEDLLTANPDLVGFVCLNDNSALACYGMCKQMDRSDAIVIGFDGSPAGKQSIAANEMTGTMVYSPVDLAKASCEAALALAGGQEVERDTMIEMWMINRDNIDEQDLENWT